MSKRGALTVLLAIRSRRVGVYRDLLRAAFNNACATGQTHDGKQA